MRTTADTRRTVRGLRRGLAGARPDTTVDPTALGAADVGGGWQQLDVYDDPGGLRSHAVGRAVACDLRHSDGRSATVAAYAAANTDEIKTVWGDGYHVEVRLDLVEPGQAARTMLFATGDPQPAAELLHRDIDAFITDPRLGEWLDDHGHPGT